jgi:hypothetical protein
MYWRSHFQSNLYIKQHETCVQPIMEQDTDEFFSLQFLYDCYRLPHVTTAVMIQITSTEPTTLKTEMCTQILYNEHVNDNICQVT